MSEKDEIEIHFPSKVPDELKSIGGISDAMKQQIAKKIEEGSVKIQRHDKNNVENMNEKCEIVLEILQDRGKFDKWVTKDEIQEIIDDEEKYLASFMQRIMKIARERSLIIKKTKRMGKTCYKI